MEISKEQINLLIDKAMGMLPMAYIPYSNHGVGAALLTKSGKIFTGCNAENAAYSPGICAERNAIYKAVSEGEREFVAIAIVGGMNRIPENFCYPCGVCRQVMREFVNPEEFQIILAKEGGEYMIKTLDEILPFSFGPENLG